MLLVMRSSRASTIDCGCFELERTESWTSAAGRRAAPSVYEASVALAGDSHAVVVWQQGVTPAFRAYAEWVSWSEWMFVHAVSER